MKVGSRRSSVRVVTGDGGSSGLLWSPDGQWLAFSAEDQDQAKAGLRTTRVDGQEERLITSEGRRNYASSVWSPDGRWLASGRSIYEVGKWQPQLLDLPADAVVVACTSPTN